MEFAKLFQSLHQKSLLHVDGTRDMDKSEQHRLKGP